MFDRTRSKRPKATPVAGIGEKSELEFQPFFTTLLRTVISVTAAGGRTAYLIGMNNGEEAPMLNVRYDTFSNSAIVDKRNERPLIVAFLAVIAAWTIPVLVALA